MNDLLSYSTAFMVGLLGSAHCIGMCGGIVNALSFAIPKERQSSAISVMLFYHGGRIISYCLIAALLGLISGWLQDMHATIALVLRTLAGLMLIAMGLYLAGWWRGLLYAEILGGHLWRYVQPVGSKLMPVSNLRQAFLLGLVWGWLPCGLVYSTLTLALASETWIGSSMIMLFFGLGTVPALILTGLMAHRVKIWAQRQSVRNIAGLLMIGFGVWTMMMPWYHAIGQDQKHGNHHSHIMEN